MSDMLDTHTTVKDFNHLAGLAEFLSNRDYPLNDILNYFARVVFSDLNVLRIRLLQYNEASNSLKYIGLAGQKVETLDNLHSPLLLSKRYPASDVFNSGEILCINTLPNWGSDYSVFQGLPLPEMCKTYIGIPVFSDGIPLAVLSILSRDVLELDEEMSAYLNAVSYVFAMYFYRKIQSFSAENVSIESLKIIKATADSIRGTELTDRQKSILKLISEERTNSSISQFLGYSASTIRQETMRIFAKLGCNSRSEAREIYQNSGKNS